MRAANGSLPDETAKQKCNKMNEEDGNQAYQHPARMLTVMQLSVQPGSG